MNLFGASEIRASAAEKASDTELEIVTEDRIWRMRAESPEDLAEWLQILNACFAVKAEQLDAKEVAEKQAEQDAKAAAARR